MPPSDPYKATIDPDQWVAYQHRAFGPLIGEHRWRVAALRRSGRSAAINVAQKLESCCHRPAVITIDAGAKYYIAESRCKSRVCPRCSLIRARTLATRIAKLIHRMDDPRFLTLTIRSTDRPLGDQVKHLRRRFAAMRRRPDWKHHVTQGVYTIEITWNDRTKQWHPHLHAIIDGIFYAHSAILTTWQDVVKDQAGVDIRAVRGVAKLANYLACYVSKSCDLDHLDPIRLAEWAVETHGLRLAQTFGGLQACKPQTEEAEPAPHRLVELDLNSVAYFARKGCQVSETILQQLEPHRGPEIPQDPDLVAAMICAFNHPFPKERPPPRVRDKHQLRLRV